MLIPHAGEKGAEADLNRITILVRWFGRRGLSRKAMAFHPNHALVDTITTKKPNISFLMLELGKRYQAPNQTPS